MTTTTGIQYRKPLNGYHQRKNRSAEPPYVRTGARMPTSEELPEASADLAEALNTWHQLALAEREQARLAADANSAAETASAAYRTAVREAMASGKDPAKVKDETDKHKAQAVAHVGFHNDARAERERLGRTLGPLLQDEAPGLSTAVEEKIEKSARSVRGALLAVRESWAVYSRDFEMRRWLSHLELDGGMVGAYHGTTPLPADVAAALALLEDHIGALDALKSDEAQVRAYRAQQAR